MNYAKRTDKVFSTKNTVTREKSMSSEVASRRKFIAAHTFAVNVNPSTKKASISVKSKHVK